MKPLKVLFPIGWFLGALWLGPFLAERYGLMAGWTAFPAFVTYVVMMFVGTIFICAWVER